MMVAVTKWGYQSNGRKKIETHFEVGSAVVIHTDYRFVFYFFIQKSLQRSGDLVDNDVDHFHHGSVTFNHHDLLHIAEQAATDGQFLCLAYS
jgi:hypothetical protein